MPSKPSELTVSVLGMCSGTDWQENLRIAEVLIQQSAEQGAKWVVLPEYFILVSPEQGQKIAIQESLGSGPIQSRLMSLAQKYNVWIFAGAIPTCSSDPSRPFSSLCVINDSGELVADYQKIHLFDASVNDGLVAEKTEQTAVKAPNYRESSGTYAGNHLVVCKTPWGKVGLAICYDLRFSEMFLQFAKEQVDFIVIPAAFTEPTGKAHWHLLVRARATECQAFVLASAQGGKHQSGRVTYGHSLIVDPFGEIIAEGETGNYCLIKTLPLMQIEQVRQRMPLHQHHRWSELIEL